LFVFCPQPETNNQQLRCSHSVIDPHIIDHARPEAAGLIVRACTDDQATHISGEGEKTARWLDRLKAADKAGSCATKGSMTYDGVTETYSVVGAGLDIWDDTDEFHYAHATLEGDGSISAKIESVEHVHNWTKVGLMIRDTLDSVSAHGHICITPLGLVTFQWRDREGGATRDASTGTLRVRLPHWVRLTRQGNRFTPEHSSDGMQWEPITGPQGANGLSPIEIPMNESVHIGLAITSRNITRAAEARISKVKITGTITPTGPLATSEDIRLKEQKSREE